MGRVCSCRDLFTELNAVMDSFVERLRYPDRTSSYENLKEASLNLVGDIVEASERIDQHVMKAYQSSKELHKKVTDTILTLLSNNNGSRLDKMKTPPAVSKTKENDGIASFAGSQGFNHLSAQKPKALFPAAPQSKQRAKSRQSKDSQVPSNIQAPSVKSMQEELEQLRRKSEDRKTSLKLLYSILTTKEKENESLKSALDRDRTAINDNVVLAIEDILDFSNDVETRISKFEERVKGLDHLLKRALVEIRSGSSASTGGVVRGTTSVQHQRGGNERKSRENTREVQKLLESSQQELAKKTALVAELEAQNEGIGAKFNNCLRLIKSGEEKLAQAKIEIAEQKSIAKRYEIELAAEKENVKLLQKDNDTLQSRIQEHQSLQSVASSAVQSQLAEAQSSNVRLTSTVTELQAVIQRLREQIKQDVSSHADKELALKNDIDNVNREIAEKKIQNEDLLRRIDRLDKEKSREAKFAEDQIKTYAEKIKQSEEKVRSISETLRSTEEKYRATEEKLRVLNAKAAQGEEKSKSWESDIKTLSEKLRVAEGNLKAFQTNLDALEEKNKQAKAAQKQAEDQVKLATASFRHAEEKNAMTESTLKSTQEKLKATNDLLTSSDQTIKRLEGEVKTLQEKLKTANERISNADATAKTVDTSVKSIQEQLRAAEGENEALRGRIGELEGEIKSLQQKLAAANGKAAESESKRADTENKRSEAESKKAEAEKRLAVLKDDLEGQILGLQGKVKSLESANKTLEENYKKLDKEFKSSREKSTEISALLNEMTQKVNEEITRASEAEANIERLKLDLQQEENHAKTQEAKVRQLESTLRAAEDAKKALAEKATYHEERFQTSEATIETLKQTIESLKQSLAASDHKERISKLEQEKQILANTFTQLENEKLLIKSRFDTQEHNILLIQAELEKVQKLNSKLADDLERARAEVASEQLKVRLADTKTKDREAKDEKEMATLKEQLAAERQRTANLEAQLNAAPVPQLVFPQTTITTSSIPNTSNHPSHQSLSPPEDRAAKIATLESGLSSLQAVNNKLQLEINSLGQTNQILEEEIEQRDKIIEEIKRDLENVKKESRAKDKKIEQLIQDKIDTDEKAASQGEEDSAREASLRIENKELKVMLNRREEFINDLESRIKELKYRLQQASTGSINQEEMESAKAQINKGYKAINTMFMEHNHPEVRVTTMDEVYQLIKTHLRAILAGLNPNSSLRNSNSNLFEGLSSEELMSKLNNLYHENLQLDKDNHGLKTQVAHLKETFYKNNPIAAAENAKILAVVNDFLNKLEIEPLSSLEERDLETRLQICLNAMQGLEKMITDMEQQMNYDGYDLDRERPPDLIELEQLAAAPHEQRLELALTAYHTLKEYLDTSDINEKKLRNKLAYVKTLHKDLTHQIELEVVKRQGLEKQIEMLQAEVSTRQTHFRDHLKDIVNKFLEAVVTGKDKTSQVNLFELLTSFLGFNEEEKADVLNMIRKGKIKDKLKKGLS